MGRFKIDRLIGRGGMGMVYLAEDLVASQMVVVKLLAPHLLEDRTAVARFEEEGQRLRQLVHPNIVQLIECGHDGSQGYIAMEYLDGEPLRRFLKRRGRLSLQEFTPIAAQSLAAVGYAHDRNIMLRDIKPANIMLCERDGKASFVKLLDFGLAKLVDGDEEVTKSHVIGTAGYLAPEQIKGEPSDVRVDVYALGVLFYLMLAGESPIQGENDGALLYNHVHGTPAPLESHLPKGHNVPERLVALVHQCLEKDPQRRPADANEVAEALFECVPPKLFALPLATDESRAAVQDYRDARDRGLERDDGVGRASSEWTKPVVRATLDAVAADASAAALARPRRSPTREVARPPRAAAPDASAELEVDPAVAKMPRPRPRPVSAVQPAGAVPPVRVPRPTPLPRPVPARAVPESDESAAATRPAGARAAHTEPAGERASVVDTVDGGPASTELGAPIATLDAGTGALQAEGTSGPIRAPLPVRRRYLVVVGALALLVGGMSAWIVFGPSSTPATGARDGAPVAGAAAAAQPARREPGGPAAPRSDDRSTAASPSSPEAPIAPTAAIGVVEVRAIEGAQVEIDGTVVGNAPHRAELSPGTHTVKITAPGYAAWEETIEVGSGDNPMIDARLKPAGKRKPGATKPDPSVAAPAEEPDEPPPPSEPLPVKPPPLQSDFPKPDTPKKPPPPPPAPEPGSSPFLPTSPGAKDDGLMPN